MATLIPVAVGGQKHRRHNLKVDMTPMVDLGFLLITFFIFTTALTQPTVTKLIMPKKDETPMPVYDKTLLTAIVDKDKIVVYEGALTTTTVQTTNLDVKAGLGSIIRQKQKALGGIGKRDELMVAIKPLNTSSYQNLISVLDEMLINNVSRYAIIPLSEDEKALVK